MSRTFQGKAARVLVNGKDLAIVEGADGLRQAPAALTVREKVVKIIANQSGDPVESITDEMHLANDLHFDSLDYVEVVMWLEEEFAIDIDDADIGKIGTVLDAINAVFQRIGVEA